MERNTKYIIFGSQKGGVGKSTLCNMLARYLANYTDKKIIVLETDPQATILGWRDNELDDLSKEEKDKVLKSKTTYQLIRASTVNVSDTLEKFYGEYDYVICDLIGTLQDKGVIEYHMLADLAFCPLSASDADVNSTADYLEWCSQTVDPLRQKNDLGKLNRYMIYIKQGNTIINKQLAKGTDFANFMNTERLNHGLPNAEKQYTQSISTLDFRDIDDKFIARDVIPLCKEMLSKIEGI